MTIPPKNIAVYLQNFTINNDVETPLFSYSYASVGIVTTNKPGKRQWAFTLQGAFTEKHTDIVYDFSQVNTFGYSIRFEGILQGLLIVDDVTYAARKYLKYVPQTPEDIANKVLRFRLRAPCFSATSNDRPERTLYYQVNLNDNSTSTATYTTSTSITLSLASTDVSGSLIQYCLVGGGGGGGSFLVTSPGGGGGGGQVSIGMYDLTASETWNLVIGAGGGADINGQESTLDVSGGSTIATANYGSAGYASISSSDGGDSGSGKSGGTGSTDAGGGGGGGDSIAGSNGTGSTGGAGGKGTEFAYNSTYYGGGGGGGSGGFGSSTTAEGGEGGGGNGGLYPGYSPPTNGSNGKGGGGGGATCAALGLSCNPQFGASGGSGVLVLYYDSTVVTLS